MGDSRDTNGGSSFGHFSSQQRPNLQYAHAGRVVDLSDHVPQRPHTMTTNNVAPVVGAEASPASNPFEAQMPLDWKFASSNAEPYPPLPELHHPVPYSFNSNHPYSAPPGMPPPEWNHGPRRIPTMPFNPHRGPQPASFSSTTGYGAHAAPSNSGPTATNGHQTSWTTPPAVQTNLMNPPLAVQSNTHVSRWTPDPRVPEFKPRTPPYSQQNNEHNARPLASTSGAPFHPGAPFFGMNGAPSYPHPLYNQPANAGPPPIMTTHPPLQHPGHVVNNRPPPQLFHSHAAQHRASPPRSSPPRTENFRHLVQMSSSSNTTMFTTQQGSSSQILRPIIRNDPVVQQTASRAAPPVTAEPDWVKKGTENLSQDRSELFIAIALAKWRVEGRLEPRFGDPTAEKMRTQLGISVTAELAGKSIYCAFITEEQTDRSTNLSCMICGKGITTSHSLEHIRKHFHHMPFLCTYDDCTVCRNGRREAFPDYNRLRQHITRAVPVRCVCGDTFRRESLRRHQENSCPGPLVDDEASST